jgi:hypothetical protein
MHQTNVSVGYSDDREHIILLSGFTITSSSAH